MGAQAIQHYRLVVLGPTVAPTVARVPMNSGRGLVGGWQAATFRLLEPAQQKTPRRGGEAFLGLLQGGEICISIYVDPWEVGGPGCAAGANRWESTGHESGAGPNQEVLCSAFQSVSLNESLNQDTNIRAIYV